MKFDKSTDLFWKKKPQNIQLIHPYKITPTSQKMFQLLGYKVVNEKKIVQK